MMETHLELIELASKSPRRRRLMAWLSIPFVSTSVDTPEDLSTPLASEPTALVAHLAAEKALATRDLGDREHTLILAFDTLVVHDGEVLGKPVDMADAWRMLRSLSGRSHEVVTGMAILAPGSEEPRTQTVSTDVRMATLDDASIAAWMARGEFMGCAGAYNIEAQVAEVTEDDCYQNVAGLPLCHLCAALMADFPNQEQLAGLTSPIASCDAALSRTCRLGRRLL